jgi:hypothetical protein
LTQYYYLVASLPMLAFDSPPPLRSGTFLRLCREQAPELLPLLERVSFDLPVSRAGDPEPWRGYAAWEAALRNELAVQRARRLGIDPEPWLRPAPFVAGLPAMVKEALAAGTPLAVETALDQRRWLRLDELENDGGFGLGRLVAYRLKLLLLERRQAFRSETNAAAFARQYARIAPSRP